MKKGTGIWSVLALALLLASTDALPLDMDEAGDFLEGSKAIEKAFLAVPSAAGARDSLKSITVLFRDRKSPAKRTRIPRCCSHPTHYTAHMLHPAACLPSFSQPPAPARPSKHSKSQNTKSLLLIKP